MTIIDTVEWSGAFLVHILGLVGVKDVTTNDSLTGEDSYYANIGVEDALKPESFLVYELEGKLLPMMHGFPPQAVLPFFIDCNGLSGCWR